MYAIKKHGVKSREIDTNLENCSSCLSSRIFIEALKNFVKMNSIENTFADVFTVFLFNDRIQAWKLH